MIMLPKALFSLFFVGTVSALAIRQEPCQAVHVFLARGTYEGYPGRQQVIASKICSGITSCGFENVIYPADGDFCTSVDQGDRNGKSAITAYAARCPNAKIVLTGYSLGANIISDILGGTSGTVNTCAQPTVPGLPANSSPAKNIAAVLLWGDPRHVANQAYNVGSGASKTGIWPRTGSLLSSLNVHASKLRSYCNSGDPVCAQGSDGNAHVTYFDQFADEAVAWAKSKL